MSLDEFDFGFTLVDENDLENVKAVTEDAEQRIEFYQEQVTKMYDLVQPLLANLEKNPELDYIRWPGANRVQKIEEFRHKLDDIATAEFHSNTTEQ